MIQLDMIRFHLKEWGSLTSWDAIMRYRCTRLSEYIRQLREEGLDIYSEWATDGKKRWVNYRLRKEK